MRIPGRLRVRLPGLSHYQYDCKRMAEDWEWPMEDMQGIEVPGICAESELKKYLQIHSPLLNSTRNQQIARKTRDQRPSMIYVYLSHVGWGPNMDVQRI